MFLADPTQFDTLFLEQLFSFLPPEKQKSLQKLRHARSRRESLLGWGLLVYAWNTLTHNGSMPEISYSKTGKPLFEGVPLYFNITHTDTLICLAWSEAGEIGVDAQSYPSISDVLVSKVLTTAEQNVLKMTTNKEACFARFWTQKEAFVKQSGVGLSYGFLNLDFAGFDKMSNFSAYGLEFQTGEVCDAALTVCAEYLLPLSIQNVTQKQMEKAIFFGADG